MTGATGFTATLEIEYPDRDLDRLTTFFRPFTVIPIAVVLSLVTRSTVRADSATYVVGSGGIVFLATVLMLLFRQKYPRWWFDWNVALTRFGSRVWGISRCKPATDEDQAVHIEIPYLAIPHYIVLRLRCIAACFCVIIAWFAILFTGRYPRPLFDFVVGVFRWWLRVAAYALLLVTDRYPSFSLSA